MSVYFNKKLISNFTLYMPSDHHLYMDGRWCIHIFKITMFQIYSRWQVHANNYIYLPKTKKKKEKQGANSSVLIKASKLLAIKTEKEIKVPPVHISILVSVPSDVPAEYVRVYAWVERLTYNNILLVLISLFFWKKEDKWEIYDTQAHRSCREMLKSSRRLDRHLEYVL